MATDPSPTRSGLPTRVLRHRNFRLLWVGSVASSSGVTMGGVIIAWLIFSGTGSAFAITALGVVEFLPTIAFGLFAGALIDRYNRRSLMILADVMRAALVGALVVYLFFFGLNLVVVLLAIGGVAAFSAVFRPTANAILPSLLERRDLADGNGLLFAGTTAAGLVGSPVGGAVLVTVGALVGLFYNSLTFVVSALLLALMSFPPPTSTPAARTTSLWSEVAEGMRYLRSQAALLWVTLASMVANFFLAMYGTYMVVYTSYQLGAGAAVFGILLGVSSAGWGAGGLLFGRLHLGHRAGALYASAWGVAGLTIIVQALSSSVPVAIAAVAGFGILGGMGNTAWLSTVQQTVPDHLLGRYFSTDEAGSFAMFPLGQIAGGILITAYGIAVDFAVAGIGASIVSFILLLHPGVRGWGRPTESPMSSPFPVVVPTDDPPTPRPTES